MDKSSKLFSQVGQYALRTVTALALEGDGACLRADDLAERTGIPPAYLAKVLRRLTRAGLLASQKGHHGGFRLARSPARLRFADVLAAVDALPENNQCVFGWGRCNARRPCPLHPSWSDLSGQITDWAQSTTVAEALERE